ncbi:hypothetical protein MAQ5080_01475 [Marinomonas aquimarina]|uniref:Uncharacterized protein n=1 Tax=Marinomonas aquimarina TaxID=295068 RepID=A0A1A8TCQ7_9GAMM|nr:hypothetical protein [Marinomonas aquimarina]SBS29697.1 hypothetical protein MAQ5080_01475 [Marinomonas aquimarina]
MTTVVLRKLTSSRYLTCLLALECALAIWAVQALWQHKNESQRSIGYYHYQENQWRALNQAIRTIPHDLPVQMLYGDEAVVGMRLQQTMEIAAWRHLIDELHKRFWLTPTAVQWRREGYQWFADITWHFVRPSTLKPDLNILPFERQQTWPSQGTLVSTLHGQRSAALIKVDQEEMWLYEGNWLPQLQATLTQVDQEYVVLQSGQGERRQLYLSAATSPRASTHKEP